MERINRSTLLSAIRMKNTKMAEERRATEKEQRVIREMKAAERLAIVQANDALHEQEVPGITSTILEEVQGFYLAILNAPEEVRVAEATTMKVPVPPTRAQRYLPWLFKAKIEEKPAWYISLMYEADYYIGGLMDDDGTAYLVSADPKLGWLAPRLTELNRTTLESMGYSFVSEFLKEMRIQHERFDRKVAEHLESVSS